MSAPIFHAFLVPGRPGTISVCFELNTDHPVLTGKDTDGTQILVKPEEITSWRKAIMEFPETIAAIRSTLKITASSGGAAEAVDYAVSAASPVFNVDTAKTFWHSFLGFNPLAIQSENPVNPILSDFQQTPRTALKMPEFIKLVAHTTLKAGKHPAAPRPLTAAGGNVAPGTVAPLHSGSTFLAAIDSHDLVASVRTDTLHATHLEGIERAHLAAIGNIAAHNTALIDQYQPGKDILASFSKNSESYVNHILGEVEPVVKDFYQKYFNRHLVRAAVHVKVVNTPNFINEAIQKLNAYPRIRRIIGTTLDLSFQPKGGTTSVQLKFQDDKIPKYLYPLFNDPPLATKIFKSTLGDNGYLMAGFKDYNNNHKNTFLLLDDISTVVTFETQSIAHNLSHIRELGLSCGNTVFDEKGLDSTAYSNVLASAPKSFQGLLDLQAVNRLFKITRRYHNQLTDIHTKGHQLYITDTKWLEYNPSGDNQDTAEIYEHNLILGYAIFVKITGESGNLIQDWISLTRVDEKLDFKDFREDFQETELPVSVDHVIHYMDDADILSGKDHSGPATDLVKGLGTGFLFNWDGTVISSRNPLRHVEYDDPEQGTKALYQMNELENTVNNLPLESASLNKLSGKVFGVDYFPYQPDNEKRPYFKLFRQYLFKQNEKAAGLLKFGRHNYQYVMAAQYFNGYTPVSADLIRKLDQQKQLQSCLSKQSIFLRHEHINEVNLAFGETIYSDDTHKSLLPEYSGEGKSDLVIRTGSITDNSSCERYILPPPVPSFQTYLWYDHAEPGKLMKTELPLRSTFEWMRKYQCELPDAAAFNKNLKAGKKMKVPCKGCLAGCSSYCGGTNPPVIYDHKINYLPDPIVTGFIVRFFLDRECLLPASANFKTLACPYEGHYPDLRPWTIRLKKARKPKDQTARVLGNTLEVVIQTGGQLFAEIIPTYDMAHAYLYEPLVESSNYKLQVDNLYANTLQSASTVISLTHASQLPVAEPVIQSIQLQRFSEGTPNKKPKDVRFNITIAFEHLNLWYNLPMPGTQPTGELDLYGIWDDYIAEDQQAHETMANKRHEDKKDRGFVYIGRILFAEDGHSGQPYAETLLASNKGAAPGDPRVLTGLVTIDAEHTFVLTYFTDAIFKIRNTSKFSRYFLSTPEEKSDSFMKPSFSRWSAEYTQAGKDNKYQNEQPAPYGAGGYVLGSNYLLNNQKPAAPTVAKIIPLIVIDDDPDKKQVRYRNSRVRVYFDHVPLTGKANRIGVILENGGSVHKDILTPFYSCWGRDSVTDRSNTPAPASQNLTPDNFNTTLTYLEQDYIDRFQPREDGGFMQGEPKIGLISYQVQYDAEQELWYIDIDLNIPLVSKADALTELHNPFIRLGILAYQPYSANYSAALTAAATKDDKYLLDYRVSDPQLVDFFSIYPSRTFTNPLLLFRNREKPGEAFQLSGRVSSLFYEEASKSVKTQFIVFVQQKITDEILPFKDYFWIDIDSDLSALSYQFGNLAPATDKPGAAKRYHCLVTDQFSKAMSQTDFLISFHLEFSKGLFQDHRVVIEEIDIFGDLSLSEMTTLIDQKSSYHLPGVRIRQTYVFEN